MKYLGIIILFVLASCAKEGKNIYIEGRVVNPVTGEGIPNIRFELKKVKPDLQIGSSSKTVKIVHSDENGYFRVAHNGSLFNRYLLLFDYELENTDGVAYHPIGFKEVGGNYIGAYNLEVPKGEYLNVNLELTPYVRVRFWHRNLNCFNSNDSIHIFRQDQYQYAIGDYKRYGCIIEEPQNSYILIPQGDLTMSWTVYRENSPAESFSEVIDLSLNDTTTFILEY
ncbi:MAG: hypothetical protein R2799_02870 [Crocinitomicaceae bacterium]